MSLFQSHDEDSLYLSMHDAAEKLSRHAETPFNLDECHWSTVEHYYQAMKFTDETVQQKISAFTKPAQAAKFASSWQQKFKVRKDWKKIKTTVMTRALYIKCRTHPDVAQKLIESGDKNIVENSQFDYYWGCGRDKRGDNHYGKVLMRVRNKLITEQNSN